MLNFRMKGKSCKMLRTSNIFTKFGSKGTIVISVKFKYT